MGGRDTFRSLATLCYVFSFTFEFNNECCATTLIIHMHRKNIFAPARVKIEALIFSLKPFSKLFYYKIHWERQTQCFQMVKALQAVWLLYCTFDWKTTNCIFCKRVHEFENLFEFARVFVQFGEHFFHSQFRIDESKAPPLSKLSPQNFQKVFIEEKGCDFVEKFIL